MRIRFERLLKAPKARLVDRDGDVTRLAVDGIVCDDVCAVRTKRALEGLPGVERVTVDYERGTATVEGRPHDIDAYNQAIAGVVAGMSARRFVDRVVGALRGRRAS